MHCGVLSADADKQHLMQQNRCFYCRKEGHQAKECRKKKMDMKGSRRINQINRNTDQGWEETNTTGNADPGGMRNRQQGRKKRPLSLN